jgi:hypothetical protein
MDRPRQIPIRSLALALVALALAAACATYTARLSALRPELSAAEYDQALEILEKTRKDKDLLLYHLERGLVLHHAGRWVESNDAFQAGEDLAEELYTKSISEGALSLLLNDNTISYRARPFEMAMIPYYRVLNYVALDRPQDAAVEARKATLFLREYTDATFAALGGDPADAELDWLRNSAFLHHLSGMIYEWVGETNDAFIAYRNAAAAYRGSAAYLWLDAPAALGADLDRTGRRLGFGEEVEFVRGAYPEIFTGRLTGDRPAGHGEVVVLLEYGFVAHKEEQRVAAPLFAADDYDDPDAYASTLTTRVHAGYVVPAGVEVIYWLSIATPRMVSDRPAITGARVGTAAGTLPVDALRIEDLEGRAQATFDREWGKILLKTLARALTKHLTQQSIDRQSDLAGFVAGLFNTATETADTRSWLTLPNVIGMARLCLPEGEHDLEIQLMDDAGRPAGRVVVPRVAVRAGDWTFVTHRIWR